MATQPIVHDPPYFTLTLTTAKPPSLRWPEGHAEGSGHGCSICLSEAYAEGDQVTIILPSAPLKLEVMVLDRETGRRYAPSEDAVRALVLTGRGRWRLPEGAHASAGMIVSYGFEQRGEMFSEERAALPPGAPRPSVHPSAPIVG